MSTTQPIRDKNEVRALTAYYLELGQLRNHVLICLGIYTALRVGDILSLSCDDVYDFDNKRVRESIEITEQKTGKTKTVAINEALVAALEAYFPNAEPGMPLILNPNTGCAISRVQAYRLVRAAGEAINLSARVSCHSLRKTFGYHTWKSGVSPAVIMDIYNHSSLAVTRRYLGVTQDDKNAAYLGLDFSA